MMKKRLLTYLAIAVSWGSALAQTDVQSSMYWAVPSLYNPAAAGADTALHISAFDRMQWLGIKNGPRTFFVSADMPLRIRQKRMGIGINVNNDRTGLFQTTILGAQGSYQINLWGGQLSLGVQLGMVNQSFDGGEVYIPDGEAWDASDAAIPKSDVSAMAFDAGAGVWYEWGMWYGGLGVQHLPGEKVNLDEYAYTQMERSFFFTAGGNIPIRRTLYILQPSVLIKSLGWTTQYDITLRATYDHKFWGGLTYRPGDAVVIMLGADIKTIRFGYAYDIGISPLASAAGGSHELLATYTLVLDLGKKKKHPHKSIRIL